jgi:hypothetical protein
MFCVILIFHAVFHVYKEIGTRDTGIIFDFHSMEHRKVVFRDPADVGRLASLSGISLKLGEMLQIMTLMIFVQA